MKFGSKVITLFLLTVTISFAQPVLAENYPPTQGDMMGFTLLKERGELPQVPFLDAEGNVRHFSDFKGRVILVNFWATWCAPCVHEMPDLDRLQADMGSDDFEVVTISQDRGGVKVAEPFMREKLKLDHLALYMDQKAKLARALKMRGLPTTYLIDRDNRLVGAYEGPAKWDSDDAKAMIQYLLDE